MIERIVNRAKNFNDADDYDIMQQISMTPEERLDAAKLLRVRYYGNNVPDVRQSHTT